MANPTRQSAPARQQGFTLVELLVVIGIIALLAGLLIPAANYVKQQGYKTRTAAFVNNVRAATEAYYQTFHAYPGPFSRAQVVGTSGIARPAGLITGGQITGTENLVLGLLGGLTLSNNTISYPTAPSTLVGTGPQNLFNSKAYSPFISADAASLSPYNGAQQQFKFPGGAVANDTNIPEFLDSYPEAMPLLYLRAAPGAPGVVQDSNQTPQLQYDMREITPYTTVAYNPSVPSGIEPRGLIGVDLPPPGGAKTGINGRNYFGDPQTLMNGQAVSPHSKDTFIIISAGPDRLYGTADDITTFGEP